MFSYQTLLIAILIGAAGGALLGHFGKCQGGACPLTANPWRGAAYGAALGLLWFFALNGGGAGMKTVPKLSPEEEKTAATRMIILQDENEWQSVLDASAKELVLAEFGSEYCPACKMQAPVLSRIVLDHSDQVRVVKIDVDKLPGLATKYAIRYLPTLIFIRNGEVLSRKVGFTDQKKIEQMITELSETQ
ncbi:MAG: thioredoxin [Lentisphaerae bacterium]|nr:MAG: thioredoxin [Lentisphaerota bacterium]